MKCMSFTHIPPEAKKPFRIKTETKINYAQRSIDDSNIFSFFSAFSPLEKQFIVVVVVVVVVCFSFAMSRKCGRPHTKLLYNISITHTYIDIENTYISNKSILKLYKSRIHRLSSFEQI